MSVAATIRPLIHGLLGPDLPIRVTCWDGSSLGPSDAPAELRLVRRRALRRLLWAPNELGLARAYVSGDAEIRGDIMAGLEALEAVSDPTTGPRCTWTRHEAQRRRRGAAAGHHRGAPHAAAGGDRPAWPAPLEGPRRAGDRAPLRRRQRLLPDRAGGVDDALLRVLRRPRRWSWPKAQQAKCDLVAASSAFSRGMRVLDIGCGWGTFARRAAHQQRRGVVGITLSREQAASRAGARRRRGSTDRVEVRRAGLPRRYRRAVRRRPRASGWPSTSARTLLAEYARDLFRAALPQGRLLNQRSPAAPAAYRALPGTSFIDRYVFPDGELESVGTMVETLETAGFEVRHVEALREHYGLTLRAWVRNLEDGWDCAVRASTPGRARVWRLYLAGGSPRLRVRPARREPGAGRTHLARSRAEHVCGGDPCAREARSRRTPKLGTFRTGGSRWPTRYARSRPPARPQSRRRRSPRRPPPLPSDRAPPRDRRPPAALPAVGTGVACRGG